MRRKSCLQNRSRHYAPQRRARDDSRGRMRLLGAWPLHYLRSAADSGTPKPNRGVASARGNRDHISLGVKNETKLEDVCWACASSRLSSNNELFLASAPNTIKRCVTDRGAEQPYTSYRRHLLQGGIECVDQCSRARVDKQPIRHLIHGITEADSLHRIRKAQRTPGPWMPKRFDIRTESHTRLR
jgi:hypothetical protein